MKAIVTTKYGSPDVLKLSDVKKPVPNDHELLIKIKAASATTADTMMRKGTPFYGRLFLGLTKPKNPITGTGFAGVVEAAGEKVTQFKIGDEVVGETGVNFSTNAEYICVPEDGLLITKPANMSFEEAAPICDGALTALNFLKEIGSIQPGQQVLVNGASGSQGNAAIQLGKYFGAEVTGVCSTANVEMVKTLGADRVIDYKKEDFTEAGHNWDIIYDTVGKSSFPKCKKALKPNGVYLSPVLSLPLLLQMLRTSAFGSKKAKFSATGMRPVPELRVLLEKLKELIESDVITTVIDRSYPLELTPEAHRYIETGHKKGNIVITI